MNINWNNYIQNNSLIRRQIATRPQDRKEEQYILHACTNKDKNDACLTVKTVKLKNRNVRIKSTFASSLYSQIYKLSGSTAHIYGHKFI